MLFNRLWGFLCRTNFTQPSSIGYYFSGPSGLHRITHRIRLLVLDFYLVSNLKVNLFVLVHPPAVDDTKFEPEINAGEGDYATLDCSVKGNPTPTITWKKGNLLVDDF